MINKWKKPEFIGKIPPREELRYNEAAIQFKEEILKSLNEQFKNQAEKLVLENGRQIIMKDDILKAILLVLMQKGIDILRAYI